MNDREFDLKGASTDELIAQFVQYALDQDATIDYLDLDRYNELDKLIAGIGQELKRRGLEARKQLLPLYNYRQAQVRLQAARFTYALTPEAARKCIQTVADSLINPINFHAQQLLESIDAGLEKLD